MYSIAEIFFQYTCIIHCSHRPYEKTQLTLVHCGNTHCIKKQKNKQTHQVALLKGKERDDLH